MIVPALDEEAALAGFLEHFFSHCDLGRGPGRAEVIVVDGGSGDGTRDLALADTRVHMVTAPPGWQQRIEAGASLACGDWLLFAAPQTRLPVNAGATLAGLAADDGIQVGAFRQRFEGGDWRLHWVARLRNRQAERHRVLHPEHGIFIRTRLYHELSTFDVRAYGGSLSSLLAWFCLPLLVEDYVTTRRDRVTARGVWRCFARTLWAAAGREWRATGFQRPLLPPGAAP